MEYKNKHSNTGTFSFNNIKYLFDGVFTTNDKDLIAYLDSADNWICLTEATKKTKKMKKHNV